MKLEELKKIIYETVQDAMRTEIRSLLLEIIKDNSKGTSTVSPKVSIPKFNMFEGQVQPSVPKNVAASTSTVDVNNILKATMANFSAEDLKNFS